MPFTIPLPTAAAAKAIAATAARAADRYLPIGTNAAIKELTASTVDATCQLLGQQNPFTTEPAAKPATPEHDLPAIQYLVRARAIYTRVLLDKEVRALEKFVEVHLDTVIYNREMESFELFDDLPPYESWKKDLQFAVYCLMATRQILEEAAHKARERDDGFGVDDGLGGDDVLEGNRGIGEEVTLGAPDEVLAKAAFNNLFEKFKGLEKDRQDAGKVKKAEVEDEWMLTIERMSERFDFLEMDLPELWDFSCRWGEAREQKAKATSQEQEVDVEDEEL